MKTIKEVVNYLNQLAPPVWQEGYDNAGLITGNPGDAVTGIVTCLDAVEAVVDEAIAQKANMIVAHHPIVFKGLKRITGRNYVERTVIKAIKHDIAIMAVHTNLDFVLGGVNWRICEQLSLQNPTILYPKTDSLLKLTTFVPHRQRDQVLAAISQAGAGQIGNYTQCSFTLEGRGTFRPGDAANPALGQRGQLETVDETRIEVILPIHAQHAVMAALRQAHPYEEVAYYLQPLANTNQEVGTGALATFATPMHEDAFLERLSDRLQTSCIRHTAKLGRPIRKVAVCGGAGSGLLPLAKQAGADAFVTSDFKYHEFFDADGQLMIADVGHYESEAGTIELLAERLKANFPDLPIRPTRLTTNPVRYFTN